MEAFLPIETYHQSLDGLIREIKGGPVRPGADAVRLPGEGSVIRGERSALQGIEIAPELWKEVAELARELGVRHPALE